MFHIRLLPFPRFLVDRLWAWAEKRREKYWCDDIYDDRDGSLYMKRRWVKTYTSEQSRSVRLHQLHRSDRDPHCHDHPWNNISIVLAGRMVEEKPDGTFELLQSGSIVVRRAHEPHRFIVLEGPVTTLFLMGHYRQKWGFYLQDGTKVPYNVYLAARAEFAEK